MGRGELKYKPHISMVKDTGTAQDRDGVAPRKSVVPAADHWAFLEEIEAPMWADLDLEASSIYKDKDDDWFEISHPFHRCSSRQLISCFPHVDEGTAVVDFSIQEPSSPKLPPSVSQSRGKTYRSREWGQINPGVVANSKHPVKNLSRKFLRVNLGAGQTIQTKPSNAHRGGNAKSKPNTVCIRSSTGTSGPSYSNPSSIIDGDSKTSSNIGSMKEEYKSTSTITSESSKNKQKLFEVSSQTFGHSRGLLSALKVTLRKSCVTRQASRVERDGGRQSMGCKSSSGQSSVGSSSHPGYVKDVILPESRSKLATPDSRNVMGGPQVTKDKVKVLSMSKDSTANNRDLTLKSRGGCKFVAAAKSKGVHSTAMTQHRANKQVFATTDAKTVCKVGVNKYTRLGGGKENTMSQRSNPRAGGMVQIQKVARKIAVPKSDKTGMVVVPKGKINGRSEEKSLTNVVQRVYFR